MINYLSRRRKGIALFCCALFLFQLANPVVLLALTSGPSQPEAQEFQTAGTTEKPYFAYPQYPKIAQLALIEIDYFERVIAKLDKSLESSAKLFL